MAPVVGLERDGHAARLDAPRRMWPALARKKASAACASPSLGVELDGAPCVCDGGGQLVCVRAIARSATPGTARSAHAPGRRRPARSADPARSRGRSRGSRPAHQPGFSVSSFRRPSVSARYASRLEVSRTPIRAAAAAVTGTWRAASSWRDDRVLQAEDVGERAVGLGVRDGFAAWPTSIARAVMRSRSPASLIAADDEQVQAGGARRFDRRTGARRRATCRDR